MKNRSVCQHQSQQQQKSEVCAKTLWKKSLLSGLFLLFVAGDSEAELHVVNIKLEKNVMA